MEYSAKGRTGKENPLAFGRLTITSVYPKKLLEKIQEKVAKATGLAFVTVDYKGEPVTDMTAFTDFCQAVRRGGGAGEMACKSSDAYGAIQATVRQQTHVYLCPCGLLEVAIPIVVQGQYLGGFIGGQVRCLNPPAELYDLKELAQGHRELFNTPMLQQKYRDIVEMSYEQFMAVADMVSLIIHEIGEREVALLEADQALSAASHKQEGTSPGEDKLRLFPLDEAFVFHCLNSIASLAMIEDAGRTNEMTTLFAELLRYALKLQGENQKLVELTAELANCERYLKIQLIRYAVNFKFSIESNLGDLRQKVPAGLIFAWLQDIFTQNPLIEHRVNQIDISIEHRGREVAVAIADNGFVNPPEHQVEEPKTGSAKDMKSLLARASDQGQLILGGMKVRIETICRAGSGCLTTIYLPVAEEVGGDGR